MPLSQEESVRNVLMRNGPFSQPGFEVLDDSFEVLSEEQILIVGAGGLGCELLKNAALSGFRDITLIDLDTIDISNLNRQFLFRKGDEGKYKAQCAAERIMQLVPECKVAWHTKPIQQFDVHWYSQFRVIIAGLDNQAAREWLNNAVLDLVRFDEQGNIDPDTVIPLIDGGTEGFGGQTRIFNPRTSSCFVCQKGSQAPAPHFHMCTPAVSPRVPEHCIQYALMFVWPKLMQLGNSPDDYKLFQGDAQDNPSPVTLDKDDPVHMTFMYNQALQWAQQHNISGVTYNLTMAVVKNIIPAIASTNAIIAAQCMQEAFKYCSFGARMLDNYCQYQGGSSMGTYSRSFKYARNPTCEACSKPVMLSEASSTTLGQFAMKVVADVKEVREKVNVITKAGALLYSRLTSDDSDLDKTLQECMIADEDGRYRDIWRIQDEHGFITQVHVTLR